MGGTCLSLGHVGGLSPTAGSRGSRPTHPYSSPPATYYRAGDIEGNLSGETVTASQHSRSQQLHHLVVLVCIIWAAPPGVASSDSLLFGCLHLATHSGIYIYIYIYIFWKKPYMSANLANDSNASRQIKETSRIVGYTARPTPGEAVPPWQATCMVHHDNLMGPPSRGGRIQSRMAPGMYHPCLSGRDTSKPRARRWPLTGGRLPREPTHAPILQPSSDATPCG